MHLFCFGTLMDPDILKIVLGRAVPDHQVRRAELAGFRRVSVVGEAYPATVPEKGARVPGLVVGPITPLERDRVQFFEGFEFVLEERTVEVEGTIGSEPLPALVCLATDGLTPEAGPWDFERWRLEDKPLFIEAATTYMATFRLYDVEEAHAVWVESRGPGGGPA